jgi:hypothetical protein
MNSQLFKRCASLVSLSRSSGGRAGRQLVLSALFAALGGIGLNAGQARALVVTVGGQPWDVTTFSGSYNDNSNKFATAANGGVMPWFGKGFLASQFAQAVGGNLGFPNDLIGLCPKNAGNPTCFGPFFPFTVAYDSFYGADAVQSVFEADTSYLGGGVAGGGVLPSDAGVIWAQATPLAVPSPLPLFGAAAAFGSSRQLRKRIKDRQGVDSTAARG